MEPAMNPALEAQAIGRVHRLGQRKKIQVIKLFMKDSVEVRLRGLLKKKYNHDKATMNHSDYLDDHDVKKTSKTNNSLVGHITQDKATLVENEFDTLLGINT